MSVISADVLALVGAVGPVLRAATPVDRSEIRRMQHATSDTDPHGWDDALAAGSRYGAVVAPPLFPLYPRRGPDEPDPCAQLAVDPDWDGSIGMSDEGFTMHGLPPLDLPFRRILNGGMSLRFFSYAQVGDVVARQASYTDITRKDGRSGPFVLVGVETRYWAEPDRPLLDAIQQVICR